MWSAILNMSSWKVNSEGVALVVTYIEHKEEIFLDLEYKTYLKWSSTENNSVYFQVSAFKTDVQTLINPFSQIVDLGFGAAIM